MTLEAYSFTGIVRGDGWDIFKGPIESIRFPSVIGPVKIALGTDGTVEIIEAPLYTTFLKEFVLADNHAPNVELAGNRVTFHQTNGPSASYRLNGYNVDTELFSGERVEYVI